MGARVRTVFLAALAGFFGVAAGWALALPVNGTYDEAAHVLRAYGSASGQIYAVDGIQRVPRGLLPADVDCTWVRRLPADCQLPVRRDGTVRDAYSSAAAYSPLYYLPVGVPVLVSPGTAGIVAGRLVSALLSALALAAAVALAYALGNRLLLAALLLVTTPMVANLAGAVNPNGLEISAGVLLWTCLLGLLRADPAPPPRLRYALVVAGTAAGAVLATLRYLGPVLLGLSLLAAAGMARPGRVAELLRRREVRRAGLVQAAALVVAAGWFVSARAGQLVLDPARATRHGLAGSLRTIVAARFSFHVDQLVGRFSYGETPLPSWLVAGWYALVAALVAPAALLAGRRACGALLAGCVALLVGLDLYFVGRTGWVAQGRYVLPAAAGLVLAPAFVTGWSRALGGAGVRRLVRVVALATPPLQLWALATVLTRFTAGPGAMVNPLHGYRGGGWLPPGGPVPALLVEVAGLTTLGIVAWRSVRPAGGPRPEAEHCSTVLSPTH